ncbi:methyltransferase domain-containing protein [Geodermatophilus sp. SYSU D00965]
MIRVLFDRAIRPPYVWARESVTRAVFERHYQVDTAGVVNGQELGLPDPRFIRYKPSALLTLRRILPPREVSRDDVFADFGSGKGRVVLQAAMRYPFRTVYGIEFAEQLHRTAQRNVEANRDRLGDTDVRLVHADARSFDIPDDLSVAYFNNPFVGEVFTAVIDRLLASVDRCPRRMRIVYSNPVMEPALLATGRVRLQRTLRGRRPTPDWSRSASTRLYEVV